MEERKVDEVALQWKKKVDYVRSGACQILSWTFNIRILDNTSDSKRLSFLGHEHHPAPKESNQNKA